MIIYDNNRFKYRYIFDLFIAQSAQEWIRKEKQKSIDPPIFKKYKSHDDFIQQKLLSLKHFNKINRFMKKNTFNQRLFYKIET